MKLPSLAESGRGRYKLSEGEDSNWNTYVVFPAQSSVAANASRRFEKGLRLALGGALVYVLSMIDIPSLDYSFRYVAPFVYWVVAALTPPFLSTIPLLLFAGLLCIVIVCACVSAIIAAMTLGDPTGKILAVVLYGVIMLWALGLNVGKKKELTIIGSYIFTYVMPLALLIALPYAVNGLSIPIPSELFGKIQVFLENPTPKMLDVMVKAVASYLREDPEVVSNFINTFLTRPLFVNAIILKVNKQLHLQLPLFPLTHKLDPLVVLQTFMKVALQTIPKDKVIDIDFNLENIPKISSDIAWINGAPCNIRGSLHSGFVFTVKTGLWLIRVLWTAAGRLGFLRNLFAFACLGYAIWVLVMIIPPIHRQRDVVRRDLADCTISINRCLRATREVLHCLEAPRSATPSAQPARDPAPSLLSSRASAAEHEHHATHDTGGTAPKSGAAGHGHSSREHHNARRDGTKSSPSERLTSNASYLKAISFSSAKFSDAVVPLKQSVIRLSEDKKRVFMSGLEPYLLSAGPMTFVVKEVDEVRERLLQCAAYVEQLCRVLFDVVRSSVVNADFGIWTPTVYKIEAIVAKAEEVYQTCGELIMMQPARIFRRRYRERVEEKLLHLKELELDLSGLHQEISELANVATDKVFYEFGRTPTSAGDDFRSRSPLGAPLPKKTSMKQPALPAQLSGESNDVEALRGDLRVSRPEEELQAPPPPDTISDHDDADMATSKPAEPVSASDSVGRPVDAGSAQGSNRDVPSERTMLLGQAAPASGVQTTGEPQYQADKPPLKTVGETTPLVAVLADSAKDVLPDARGASFRAAAVGLPNKDSRVHAKVSHQETRVRVQGKHASNSPQTVASLDQEEARNVSRTMDHMPLSMALVAKYHAAFKEPVALAKAVQALHEAQRRKTWKNLLTNLAFPLLPMIVHLARLTITPLGEFLVWRKNWRGPNAWWRDPEVWYLVKFFVPMLLLFSFAVFFKDFSQYTWGQELTSSPMILDYSTQGITTRTVPWIMLGFLTCLQTTYNGTVFRGMNRLVGIVFGSATACLVMYACGHSIAKIVCFSCCLLFLDVFIMADCKNPNYGFHAVWGYAGMVFTYTHVLVVGLAFEELGGLTGSRDYLVVTRIVSNAIGILLALIVAHIPPVCSGNNAASERYGESLESCSLAIGRAVKYLLDASDQGTGSGSPSQVAARNSSSSESHHSAAASQKTSGKGSGTKGTSQAGSGEALVAAAASHTGVSGEAGQEKARLQDTGGNAANESESFLEHTSEDPENPLQDALSIVRGRAADTLEAGQRFYKEGCSQLSSFPWRTNAVLEEVYLTVGSIRKRVEDMCELLKDFMTEGYGLDDRTFRFSDVVDFDHDPQTPVGNARAIGRPEGAVGSRQQEGDVKPEEDAEGSEHQKGQGVSPAGTGALEVNGSENVQTAHIPEPGSETTVVMVHGPGETKPKRGFGAKRKGSLYVLKEGNAVAVTELFRTKSGPKLREEMAAAVYALQRLSEAVAMELRVLVPTTVDRIMSHFCFARGHKKISPELPDAVHERCRDNVETAFSHLTITLSTCLVEHRMEFEESVARRRAAAFTVMAIIYYLDMHKNAVDSIHESLVGRREDSPPARCFLSCFRPSVESLGVD